MSEPRRQRYADAADVIGAIRLAVEAGSSDSTRVTVLRELLATAPPTEAGNTESVRLLIDAVRAADAECRVTDHKSEIRRQKGRRQ